jgi:DNA replication protein DnaC
MMIRSNGAISEWRAVIATTILGRLLHRNHVVTIRRDSYRLRAKR